MVNIGVAAEGVTDQQLIERLLTALCDTSEKPNVNYLQPPTPQKPGNWDQLLQYIRSERFRGAFATNDFVVIQIDTDVCEQFTPPIRRTDANGQIPTETLIEQVRQHLIARIESTAPGYYEQRKSQILFAIAVHSIECWLLPLYCDRDNQKKRQDNCLSLLNQKLTPLGFSVDENSKGKGYTRLLKDDKIRKLKRNTVLEISPHNPGFLDFVAQVEAQINTPAPGEPDAAKEP